MAAYNKLRSCASKLLNSTESFLSRDQASVGSSIILAAKIQRTLEQIEDLEQLIENLTDLERTFYKNNKKSTLDLEEYTQRL